MDSTDDTTRAKLQEQRLWLMLKQVNAKAKQNYSMTFS
jgi:hypothetical protein